MIGSVRGTVLERTPTGDVLVEVGGVGYRVLVPTGSLPVLAPSALNVPQLVGVPVAFSRASAAVATPEPPVSLEEEPTV